jgi:hypothetical protein
MDKRRDGGRQDPRRRKSPGTLPEDDIAAVDLDLRSNGENDWQDEMPGERRDQPRRRHVAGTSKAGDGDGEPDDAYGDSDSARTGGATPAGR